LRTSAIFGGLAVLNQLYEVLLPTDHLLQHLQPALLGLAMVNTVRVAYESVEEAMNLRQTLHAQLLKTVALIETPLAVVPDKVAHLLPLQIMSVINVLRDLLVLVDNAAEQQLNTLPHVYYVELKSELPALVLAWREYQLMSQFDALQQRNPHVIHPLFISTHKLVEVLK
jgi:prophage DNA circulation protein